MWPHGKKGSGAIRNLYIQTPVSSTTSGHEASLLPAHQQPTSQKVAAPAKRRSLERGRSGMIEKPSTNDGEWWARSPASPHMRRISGPVIASTLAEV